MRSVLLKATLGLFAIAGIGSIGAQARAQSYSEWGGFTLPPANAPGNYVACAGVAGGNMTNGTPFVLAGCNAKSSNGFTGAGDQALSVDTTDYIESGGFFYYSIRNAKNFKKCMGVSGGSQNNNATVVIWDCLGTSHTDQYWLLFPDASTGCNIMYNYNSGMRLASTSSSSNLVQRSDASGWPIEWCPHPVSP
jgi:hypothetical protein